MDGEPLTKKRNRIPKYGSAEQKNISCDSSDTDSQTIIITAPPISATNTLHSRFDLEVHKAQSICTRNLNLWNLSTTWTRFTGFNSEVTLCKCNSKIPWTVIWIFLHTINCAVTSLMFVSHPPNPHKPWCIVHELNFILLQCQSCILYLCTFYIMKNELFLVHLNCVSKYNQDNHNFCFRTNCLGWLSVLIVSVTELIQAGDPNGWKFGPHGLCLEYSLACFDTLRFVQCVVTFFFIYAYLDGFKQEFNEFIESHFEGTTVEELEQVVEIDNVNMTEFKKDYHKITKRFKVFMKQWKYFITLYGVLNGFSVILLCVAIIKNYLNIGCSLPATYYIHSTCETSFQFIYGLLLAFKLNRNHNLISNYKDRFQKWVTIKNSAAKESLVNEFLKSESEEGPSNQILIIFVSTCFIPTVLHIWSYFTEK